MRFNVPRRCWQGARELLELVAVGGGTRGRNAACKRIGLLAQVRASATVAAAVGRSTAETMPPVTDTNWRRTNSWPASFFKMKPQPKLTLRIAKTS